MFGESDTNKDGKIDFDGKTEFRRVASELPIMVLYYIVILLGIHTHINFSLVVNIWPRLKNRTWLLQMQIYYFSSTLSSDYGVEILSMTQFILALLAVQ